MKTFKQFLSENVQHIKQLVDGQIYKVKLIPEQGTSFPKSGFIRISQRGSPLHFCTLTPFLFVRLLSRKLNGSQWVCYSQPLTELNTLVYLDSWVPTKPSRRTRKLTLQEFLDERTKNCTLPILWQTDVFHTASTEEQAGVLF